jgi:hypothetical protein
MSESELRGWKEISTFLNASLRTVQRWEAEFEMPVHRLAGDKRGGTVWAIPSELTAWKNSFDSRELDLDNAPGPDDGEGAPDENEQVAPSVDEALPAADRFRGWVGWKGGVALLLTAAVAIVAWVSLSSRANPQPQPGSSRTPVVATPPEGNVPAGGGVFSQRRIILTFTDDEGSKFTVRVPDGSMATTAVPGIGKFGVVATLDSATITLGVARLDTINSRGSVRVTQLAQLQVKRGVSTSLHSLGYPMRVEWSGEDEAKVTPGDSDDAAHRCCLTCQPVTMCGQQVNGPCGSCRALATIGTR